MDRPTVNRTLPGTERKGQQEVTSAEPKASKRHLTFCPIPTIQELEAQEAKDADADSIFEEPDAPAAEASPKEATVPVAKGWLQNATRKAPLGRYGSRKMSRGASSILPPAPSLHAAPSTRLSQLQGALSPKNLPAPKCISPQRPHSRASPHASPGLKSPSRFKPVLSSMSPQSERHVGSPLFSPGKSEAAQHSIGRGRPAQRTLLTPERSRAIHNLLLPNPHDCRPQSKEQAGVSKNCQDVAVSGNDGANSRGGAHLKAVPKGPRPGSATFSSTVPPQAGATERQKGFCRAVPTPPPSPFATVVPNQLGAPDNMIGQRQGGSAAGPAARPQSASFSSQMLQQGAMDAPVSRPPLQVHPSSPTHDLPTAHAGTSEDRLGDRVAASPEPAPLAESAWLATAGAVGTAAPAQDGLPGVASADKALQGGRPASAFASVADLPAPMDWQASQQMEPPMAEKLTCAVLTSADAQPEAAGSVTAQPSCAAMEVVERKMRRKLTKRKRVDPSMESQPLASANHADAEAQAQCMTSDGVNIKASSAHCTVAAADGHGIQAGPEPSSPGVAHELAETHHTAAEDTTQLQERPALHSDREEGLLVATGASPDKGFVSEAVCVSEAECVEHVAEGADSQDGSLAAGPPNDDEAEVPASDPRCSSPVAPEDPASVTAMFGEHAVAPAQQPLAVQPDHAESHTPGGEAAAQHQHQVDALAPEGTAAPESTAVAHTSPGTFTVDHQAEGAPQQRPEADIPQQQDAPSPTQQADSMADAPAVLEADSSMHENDIAARAALVPAEVADTKEADTPDTEHVAADAQNAVPAPVDHAPTANFRKSGRQRKPRKPTAGALDVAPRLDEGKSAGRPDTRSLAKTLRSGKTVMPPSMEPSTANIASGCNRPHQSRSRPDAKHKSTTGAGTSAEVQPEVGRIPSDATADPAAGSASNITTQQELGCSKCRYVITGCSACRPKLAGSKRAAGRAGRKRAPSASAAPHNADGRHPISSQAAHKGEQLPIKQGPAEGAEPNSRAARTANRAVKEPISKGGSDAESDAEQLAIKPMPRSLKHRKLQSSSQHEAHQHKQPMVKAVVKPKPQEAVTVDLPADRPSSSAVAQTATLDSSASPSLQLTHPPLEATHSLRRSTRHQQSAQPAALQVIPEDVTSADAQAATAAAAAPTAAATPAAPETVRRSGRARKPALLQYEQLTKARGSRSPPDDAPKAQPPQSKAGRIGSAPSKRGKRAACEHPVIDDSEDDTPSASTAAAAAAVAPVGKSTASKKKKVCRRPAAAPALPPIQEEDEEQQPDHPSEFVHHMVHTHSDTAQHLGGLIPAEKPKRRRKAPASVRSGSSAKSRLAVSAEHSHLQTEPSNPMDVLLAAAEYTEAQANEHKAAPSKGTKRKKAAPSGRTLRQKLR